MDPERWKRLRELFDAALALEAPERPAFITRSCEGDPDLQNTLESLLEHSLETGSTFDQALIEAVDLEGSIPTSLDFLGRTLGRYRIIDKIGEGGMGEVYRATDTDLGRDVAIKILPEGFTRDPERMARFKREAQVLASLNHPNIATIHGIEETEGIRYLVLELVGGETLRSRLEKGPVQLKAVVRLAAQIAEGLAKAHEAGIVHRDLKPDNLMLTDEGFIKILDFGLAKTTVELDDRDSVMPTKPDLKTEPGRVMGTTSYMSPEQARGEALDHRSDQFAFGSVLYEMATGTRAFGGPTDADTLVAIMRSEPERPEDFDARVPPPLRWLIERCLAKEPVDRYESTRDLARDLRNLTERLREVDGSKPEGATPPPMWKVRSRVLAAAFLGLAVATTAVLWWQSQERTGEEVAAPVGVTTSIAVLPLENLGPGDEEYFADGMTDALITHLAKIEALKVISRTSVMRYKGSQKSLPEIARELGVETVLTGSVLHAGDRVRISTQLTEADTDRNLWAESYERDLSDILALQSEVARAIAGAVKVEVNPEVGARMATSRTVDPEAHEAYLRGLAELERASWEANHRDLIRASFGHLQRAIEIEPEWAEPHAELAGAYLWLASLGGVDVQTEFYPKSKATALRALELDDTVAVAQSTLAGVLLLHEWDWTAAEQAFWRAVELDPNHSSWNYARFLQRAGRYDESFEQFNRARERFPTSPILRYQLGWAYLCAGRPGEAEAEARRLLEAAPYSPRAYLLLGMTFLHTSRYEEAVTALDEVREYSARNPWLIGWLPYGKAKAGRLEEAREMLHDLEASGFDWFPELYMALGQEDKAMAQIEAAFEVRRDILLGLRCSSEYESFMENPRFREIVEAIGFPY